MNRDFKGIWIPKEIWLSKDLTTQEKLFLVEIDSLDNEEGCTAGNQYFADFFEISTRRVSEVIQNLVTKGYITSKMIYKENSKQISHRVLHICRPPYPILMQEGYGRKVLGGIEENFHRGIEENFQDNNTRNNNTNNKRKKETKYNEIIDELIFNDEIKDLLHEFIKMRMLKKKPLTDRALKIQINKLLKLSSNVEEQKQIIEKSIVKNWDEFYPLQSMQQQVQTDSWADFIKNNKE